jgi:hypothetical protein
MLQMHLTGQYREDVLQLLAMAATFFSATLALCISFVPFSWHRMVLRFFLPLLLGGIVLLYLLIIRSLVLTIICALLLSLLVMSVVARFYLQRKGGQSSHRSFAVIYPVPEGRGENNEAEAEQRDVQQRVRHPLAEGAAQQLNLTAHEANNETSWGSSAIERSIQRYFENRAAHEANDETSWGSSAIERSSGNWSEELDNQPRDEDDSKDIDEPLHLPRGSSAIAHY